MKRSQRLVFPILFVSNLLLFGMLFWPFILTNIIEPLGLITWLLVRIFVLSVDQRYYWGGGVFILVLFLFRLLPQGQVTAPSDGMQASNATLSAIEQWRIRFTPIGHNPYYQEALRRELRYLLLSHYASTGHTPARYALLWSMQNGEIPLPKHIHAFLFPEESKELERGWPKFMQSIRNTTRKWTGQETAEYYQVINEVLDFMESMMEVKR